MPEKLVEIETSDGRMEAFIAYPDGDGPFSAVVMMQHVGGLSESMRAMARRIAEGGYACVVPALYYRLGSIVVDPLDPDERVTAIRTVARNSLSNHYVLWDIYSTLQFLDQDPLIRRGPKGIIGYGLNGGRTLLAAANFPETFPAAAVVLGGHFVTEGKESPHLAFSRLKAEVYCSYCEVDPVIAPSVYEQLKELFEQHSVRSEFVFHPNVVHGYPFPNRKVYNHDAAETEWASIFKLFDKYLVR